MFYSFNINIIILTVVKKYESFFALISELIILRFSNYSCSVSRGDNDYYKNFDGFC